MSGMPFDVTKYIVYARTVPGGIEKEVPVPASAAPLEVTITNLQVYTKYSVTVKAYVEDNVIGPESQNELVTTSSASKF